MHETVTLTGQSPEALVAVEALDALMSELSGQRLADTGAVIDRLLDIRSMLLAQLE